MSVIAEQAVLLPHAGKRTWLSLRARMSASALDRQLADGAEPESSDLLFAHASRIVSPSSCASLAASLLRVLVISQTPRRISNRAPWRPNKILSVRDEMLALADRLDRPGPLRARGVAQIRVLLTDGSGSLYHPGAGGSRLRSDLRAAFEYL
jgi:hypothetical protein